jgi:hypothetical protein
MDSAPKKNLIACARCHHAKIRCDKKVWSIHLSSATQLQVSILIEVIRYHARNASPRIPFATLDGRRVFPTRPRLASKDSRTARGPSITTNTAVTQDAIPAVSAHTTMVPAERPSSNCQTSAMEQTTSVTSWSPPHRCPSTCRQETTALSAIPSAL